MSIETEFIPDFSAEIEEEKTTPEFSSYNQPATVNLMKKRGMLLPGETPREAFQRTIDAFLKIEAEFGAKPEENADFGEEILTAIDRKEIILGTPILTNAGREGRPTSACVVIPVDLRADSQKIKETIQPYFEHAMGSGFDLSDVEDPVKTLYTLNRLTREIEKNCERPVAGMGSLRVDHPKILEFIAAKRDADFLDWRFNISVSCTNDFMRAVESDQEWPLKDDAGKIVQKIPARQIFTAIADNAHHCGEPGVLFMDRFAQDNPVPEIAYRGVAPCAEIAMAPGEVCQFSYINLSELIRKTGGEDEFDFSKLKKIARNLTRFLDDSVEISAQNAVGDADLIRAKRSIGIGVCGAADLFMKLNIPYDSPEARELMENIIASINYHSKSESVTLAKSRGAFPYFQKSRFRDREWTLRNSQDANQVSQEMWEHLADQIAEFGIRNASTTALPPTGTSSRLVGASASIEPRLTLVDQSGELLPFVKSRVSSLLREKGYDNKQIDEALREIATKNNLNAIDLPAAEKNVWQTANEIPAEGHMLMQEAAQKYLDEAISKTFNLRQEITKPEVEQILLDGYHRGLKGITIFREGCLSERDLDTK